MRKFDPDLGYVYCALASSGAVKIGMTTKPTARMRDLRNMCKIAMLTIDDFCISREVVRPLLVEQEILNRVGKTATLIFGNEWFYDAKYYEIKAMIKSIYSSESQIESYFIEKQRRMDMIRLERLSTKNFSAR